MPKGGNGLVVGHFGQGSHPGFSRTFMSGQSQPMSGAKGSQKKKRAKAKSKARY